MMRYVKKILLVVILLSCGFAFVTAQQNSTRANQNEDDSIVNLLTRSRGLIEDARKKKYPFAKHIWWWGLKALSILFTIKIKLVLLFLFLGGGIFYGLKVWQGTALGCPEPLIQEVVKHHEHESILPYHGYADSYSSYPITGSGDFSGVYSLTPGPVAQPSPSYSPVQPVQQYVAPTYLPPSDAYGAPATDISTPNRRYSRDVSKGRQITEETQSIFSDLIFTFLGVTTDVCRKRFVCELEFRNPQLRGAIRYIGIELFAKYVTPKNQSDSPKEFADCEKMYSECKIPDREPNTYGIGKRRRKFNQKKNVASTGTENEVETSTVPMDAEEISNYVQRRSH